MIRNKVKQASLAHGQSFLSIQEQDEGTRMNGGADGPQNTGSLQSLDRTAQMKHSSTLSKTDRPYSNTSRTNSTERNVRHQLSKEPSDPARTFEKDPAAPFNHAFAESNTNLDPGSMRQGSEGDSKFRDYFDPARSSTVLTHSNSNKFISIHGEPGVRLQVELPSRNSVHDNQGPETAYEPQVTVHKTVNFFDGFQIGSQSSEDGSAIHEPAEGQSLSTHALKGRGST